jgi:hypothetical protein
MALCNLVGGSEHFGVTTVSVLRAEVIQDGENIAGYTEEVGSKKQVTGAGVTSRSRDGEEKRGHGRGR